MRIVESIARTEGNRVATRVALMMTVMEVEGTKIAGEIGDSKSLLPALAQVADSLTGVRLFVRHRVDFSRATTQPPATSLLLYPSTSASIRSPEFRLNGNWSDISRLYNYTGINSLIGEWSYYMQ